MSNNVASRVVLSIKISEMVVEIISSFSVHPWWLVRFMQTTPLTQFTSNKLLLLLPDTYNTSLSVTEPEYFVPGKTYPAPGVWKN